jgi:hypothetical protein
MILCQYFRMLSSWRQKASILEDIVNTSHTIAEINQTLQSNPNHSHEETIPTKYINVGVQTENGTHCACQEPPQSAQVDQKTSSNDAEYLNRYPNSYLRQVILLPRWCHGTITMTDYCACSTYQFTSSKRCSSCVCGTVNVSGFQLYGIKQRGFLNLQPVMHDIDREISGRRHENSGRNTCFCNLTIYNASSYIYIYICGSRTFLIF